METRSAGGPQTLIILAAVVTVLAGCRGLCTSANDCYAESLGGESENRIAGGTATWVGRYTENHHPVSYGVRFLDLDYDGLASAKPVTLSLPEPGAELKPFVKGERIALAGSGAASHFVLSVERVEGDIVTVSIPVNDVTSRKTVSGSIQRPANARGWYPQRYCISFIDEDVGPATTIGVDQFALPRQTPPAPANSGVPDDVYGC